MFALSQLIGQVVTAVPVSDLINQWTTSIVGMMIALGTLGGLILKFVQSHTHSPRIAALEADMQNVKQVATELKQAQPQIVQGASVITQVVPSLQTAANNHETQIALLKQQLDAITAKINLLTTIVPAVSIASSKSPVQLPSSSSSSEDTTNTDTTT